MSTARTKLLASLSATIADYRKGIPPRSPELIDAWLEQFPEESQEPLLDGLNHVLRRTYISKDAFRAFLTGLAGTDKLAQGEKPGRFWKSVNFLDIQRGGRSQKEILSLFDGLLEEIHGFGVNDAGSPDGEYVYLDDCIGTGSRVRTDLCAWLEGDAPEESKVHIITPVLYAGSYWIDDRIAETAAANGKKIHLQKWRLEDFHMENRRAYRNSADVLWPSSLPADPDVQAYVKSLEAAGYPPILRKPGNPGASGIFRDDAQKQLMEHALLVRGCEIRRDCANLRETARPLGYQTLQALGFGSMFVTFRNCPNNCPLAFWVQQEEYPTLFPRRTNAQTAAERTLRGR